MHVEGSSGNICYEAAQMYYVHIRIKEYYTLDEANDAWDQHDKAKGHRLPHMFPGVLKGTTDGKPHSGTKANFSASQALTFATYSISVIEPLLLRHGKHVPGEGTRHGSPG